MPLDPTPVPTGPEFRVGTAGQNQRDADVAALADGGLVVTWQATDPSGDGSSDVFARRYTASGAGGQEFRVNNTALGEQIAPDVAALADGGFVVVWQSPPNHWPSASDIQAQRYAADGVPVGGELLIRGPAGYHDSDPAVSAVADGFAVVWQTQFVYGPATVAQRFDADGGATGDHFTAGGTFFRGRSGGGEAAAFADGGFVVSSHGGGPYPLPGGSSTDVYLQRFNGDGTEAGALFRANSAVEGRQYLPDVTVLPNGGFVVTWQGSAAGGEEHDVYARRFGADGAPLGDEFRVHDSVAGDQRDAEVTALPGGGFLIAWQSGDPSGTSGLDVHARRFGADGAPVGGEFLVHDAIAGDQRAPEVATLADGGFVVTWQGDDGVYARVFDGAPPSVVEIATIVPSRAEGDAGATTTFTFDVSLDTASSASRSVRWQVEGRGARAADAADFAGGALPSGELVFAAGETRKTITVHVAGDAVVERDEGFAVSLLSPSDGLAVGAGGTAAATILDDDMPASAPPAHAAMVMRLYDAALDRSPERGGFEFWVGALGKGEALSSLAAGFLASPEFAARFGDASADDGAFVERLYQNVLGRAGEAEGRAFWGDSLGKGCSRAEVLAAFSESAEHVALTAALSGEGSGLLIA